MQHKVKKSLGQNFLKSTLALKKIIEAGDIQKDDFILEIGPGKGALTKKLLETGTNVLAIEKDDELFVFLQEKFKKEIQNKKLILLNEDILKINIEKTILSNYKIIANIPYNITGAILKKFLSAKNQPERMVLMVQHEVAKRIVAQDPHRGGINKKESILSISIKAYGEPKIIMKVPARYFSPAPKVDSAIINIKNISKKNFIENDINEEIFWEIVKTGFAHKRKKLSSNIKSFLKNLKNKENLLTIINNKRAEDLSLIEWIQLIKILTQN